MISKVASNLDEKISFKTKIKNYTAANQSIYLDHENYEGENTSVATLRPYTGYEVSYSAEKTEDENEYHIEFEVKNTGAKEIKETIVCATFYNDSLGIIGFQKKTLDQAPEPEEQRTINLNFNKRYYKLKGGKALEESAPLTELIDSYELHVRGSP